MIGCLRTRVRKQPIIALYFEVENELKFYNLEASLLGLSNNQGSDQPAHPRSLISTFVIHLLGMISELATSKISLFYLFSVAKHVGLGMTWSETLKTGFLALLPNCKVTHQNVGVQLSRLSVPRSLDSGTSLLLSSYFMFEQ